MYNLQYKVKFLKEKKKKIQKIYNYLLYEITLLWLRRTFGE